jgi:hypothetical protein
VYACICACVYVHVRAGGKVEKDRNREDVLSDVTPMTPL